MSDVLKPFSVDFKSFFTFYPNLKLVIFGYLTKDINTNQKNLVFILNALETELSIDEIDELDAVNIEVVKKIISNIISDIPKELSDRKYTLQTSGTENVYTSFHLKIEDLGEQPADNSIGQHADNNININPMPEHIDNINPGQEDNIDLSGNVDDTHSLPG